MGTPSWDDVEVGDRVVVEQSGVVTAVGSSWIELIADQNSKSHLRGFEGNTLKSLEKPVTTFEPGDVVRSRSTGRLYTIGSDGRQFKHQNARWGRFDSPQFVNSKNYELVS